jgi:hypothetical protein
VEKVLLSLEPLGAKSWQGPFTPLQKDKIISRTLLMTRLIYIRFLEDAVISVIWIVG